MFGGKTRRLKVKYNVLVPQTLSLFVVNSKVIQVINKICLAAINYFERIIFRKFQTLQCMIGIRKRLHNAVVRNGHCRMPPFVSPAHQLIHMGNTIHITHLRMGMKFHSLHRRMIFSSDTESFNLLHSHNASDSDFLIIRIKTCNSLYADEISFFYHIKKICLCNLLIFNKHLTDDRVGVIRDRESDNLLLALDLTAFHISYHTIDHDFPDLILNLFDRHNGSLAVTAIKNIDIPHIFFAVHILFRFPFDSWCLRLLFFWSFRTSHNKCLRLFHFLSFVFFETEFYRNILSKSRQK